MILTEEQFATLMQGTRLHKTTEFVGRDESMIPYAKNFIRQRSWEDDPADFGIDLDDGEDVPF